MKTNVREILVNQAEWQKSRKAVSWGDKIRQVERARDSLGDYGYKTSGMRHGLWSLREKDESAV